MTELLHLSSEYERRCLWCGDSNMAAAEKDRTIWKASPLSCYVARPLTMAVFEASDQFSPQGFDPDAIKITHENLNAAMARMTPLVRRDEAIYRIELPDARRTAFTWEPRLLDRVAVREIAQSPTFHGCGYHGFFKPSIAEVLAQMPEGIEANGFYIDGEVKVCQQGDGHVAVTHWVQIEGENSGT